MACPACQPAAWWGGAREQFQGWDLHPREAEGGHQEDSFREQGTGSSRLKCNSPKEMAEGQREGEGLQLHPTTELEGGHIVWGLQKPPRVLRQPPGRGPSLADL